MKRIVTVSVGLALLVLGRTEVSAQRQSVYLKKAEAEADRLLESGKLEEAAIAYKRLLFAAGNHRKAKRELKKIHDRLVEPLLESAAEQWDEDRERALQLMTEAYYIDPKNDGVKKAFKKRGYKWYEGRYRTKEQIEEHRKESKERGEKRRKALDLPEDFTIIPRPPFRFYTDVDYRDARSVLEQMMNSIQSHFYKYLEVMEPFGLRYPEEGLDVILFNDAEDYFKVTGAPRGSAGVYLTNRGAGHFFRIQGTYNFPTMLHEMTHQLNHKVLQTIGLSGWYEEGISEYFGAGFLTKGGKRIELGRPDVSRLLPFSEAVRGVRGEVIPLDTFLGLSRVQLTGQYYAQAWALTHYLMEGPPPGRFILYDFLASAKLERFGKGEARTFESILESYGLTLEAFEKAFLAFYRKG